MVFFFTAKNGYTIYMGEDKFENEDLIKYGWPEDVWFHVDDLSSAHVYLRMHEGETMDMIPEDVVEDCCQLVKANSIEGSKLNDVKVVYTPWANLKKTQGMEAGAVGFHDEKNKRYRKVVKENVIVNRLKKTKREEKPNLQELQRKRLKEINAAQAEAKRKAAQQEKERQDEKRKRDLQKHYQDGFFDEEKMVSNKDLGSNFEEDFM